MIEFYFLAALSASGSRLDQNAEMQDVTMSATYETCARDVAGDRRSARTVRYSDNIFLEVLQNCGANFVEVRENERITEQTYDLANLYVETLALLNTLPVPERSGPPPIRVVPTPHGNGSARTESVRIELDSLLRDDLAVLSSPLMVCMNSVLSEQNEISPETIDAEISDAAQACDPVANVTKTEAFRLMENVGGYVDLQDRQKLWAAFTGTMDFMLIASQLQARGLSQGEALRRALERREP